MEVTGKAKHRGANTTAFRSFPRERSATEEPVPPGDSLPGELTLRDWFAGQALVGVLAKMTHEEYLGSAHIEIANDAYDLAEAMLERRSARPKSHHG